MKTLAQANFTERQAEWVNNQVATLIGLIEDGENAENTARKMAADFAKQNGVESFSIRAYQVWNGQTGEASEYYVTVGYGEYVELDWTKCPLCVAENTPIIETEC